MIPIWLHVLSLFSLLLGLVIAVWIGLDEIRHPQHMWIMNVVWPVTALFGTIFTLWLYRRYGRLASKDAMAAAQASGEHPSGRAETPFPAMVAKGASHCGSGCALGDMIAEFAAFFFPGLAVLAGWHSLFAEKMFAVWILDFVVAFILGVAFQYFTITPMRKLSPGRGLVEALKADTLSLISWQVGMYGLMAVAQFLLFRPLLGADLKPDSIEFWFVMQIAMIAGFITSYPVNWWLLRAGIKEKM